MKKFLITILMLIVVVVAGAYGTFKYKNREHGPDIYAMYQAQDTTVQGKAGVFLILLSSTCVGSVLHLSTARTVPASGVARQTTMSASILLPFRPHWTGLKVGHFPGRPTRRLPSCDVSTHHPDGAGPSRSRSTLGWQAPETGATNPG